MQAVRILREQADHLNTPRAIEDATQKVVWRWDQQEPFGNSPANDDPDGDSVNFTFQLRFPGQYSDAETSLAYNYYRNYDPSLGRFSESDPLGIFAGVNTYVYVNGKPVGYIDAFGLFNYWKGAAAVASAVVAAGSLATGLAGIAGGTAAIGTGAGIVVTGPAYAWGAWRLWVAYNRARVALKLWKEASKECSSEGSIKNLLALAPWGTNYDDPNESFEISFEAR